MCDVSGRGCSLLLALRLVCAPCVYSVFKHATEPSVCRVWPLHKLYPHSIIHSYIKKRKYLEPGSNQISECMNGMRQRNNRHRYKNAWNVFSCLAYWNVNEITVSELSNEPSLKVRDEFHFWHSLASWIGKVCDTCGLHSAVDCDLRSYK
jgi:hypothetical protein